jgi:hypothetical protein
MKKSKLVELAGAGERFVGGAQAFEHADGILVVNRENDGGADAFNLLFLARVSAR